MSRSVCVWGGGGGGWMSDGSIPARDIRHSPLICDTDQRAGCRVFFLPVLRFAPPTSGTFKIVIIIIIVIIISIIIIIIIVVINPGIIRIRVPSGAQEKLYEFFRVQKAVYNVCVCVCLHRLSSLSACCPCL